MVQLDQDQFNRLTRASQLINIRTDIKVKKLLEIGSRDGRDTYSLAMLFNLQPDDCYIYDANPHCIELIKSNYPELKNVFNNAVYNNELELDFNAVTPDSGRLDHMGASSLLQRAEDNLYDTNCDKIKVKAVTGLSILNSVDFDFDFCKFDVEGCSYEVLESFGKELYRCKAIYIENEHHEFWKNQKTFEAVAHLFYINGFKCIDIFPTDEMCYQTDSLWVHESCVKGKLNV